MRTPTERLRSLTEIVERAGEIARARQLGIGRELKPDGSIVTDADRETETFLRKALVEFQPGSTVWGEEFGFEAEGEGGLWLVDPIDGTTNYSFGSPLWGVSVALVRGDRIELGVVVLPRLGETFSAEAGAGAFLNGGELPLIEGGPIRDEEPISASDAIYRQGKPLPGKARCSGAFVVDGTFTACGRLRAMIGQREKLYDVAACVLMAQEVGLEVSYGDGAPFEIEPLKQPVSIGRPWTIAPAGSDFRFGG